MPRFWHKPALTATGPGRAWPRSWGRILQGPDIGSRDLTRQNENPSTLPLHDQNPSTLTPTLIMRGTSLITDRDQLIQADSTRQILIAPRISWKLQKVAHVILRSSTEVRSDRQPSQPRSNKFVAWTGLHPIPFANQLTSHGGLRGINQHNTIWI